MSKLFLTGDLKFFAQVQACSGSWQYANHIGRWGFVCLEAPAGLLSAEVSCWTRWAYWQAQGQGRIVRVQKLYRNLQCQGLHACQWSRQYALTCLSLWNDLVEDKNDLDGDFDLADMIDSAHSGCNFRVHYNKYVKYSFVITISVLDTLLGSYFPVVTLRSS